MTTLRIALAPVVLAFVFIPLPRPLLAVVVVCAFLSDWLDGIVARRLGVATACLRRYDVVADVIFYLAAVLTAFLLESNQLQPYALWFGLLLGAEIVVQIWHCLCWGTSIATHSWACKIWSVVMAAALIALLGFHVGGWLLTSAFVLGTIAYLDVILILTFARQVPLDVISCVHVWRSSHASDST